MNVLVFFLLAHLILGVFSGLAEGGGGVQVTYLTSAITDSTTTIPVDSTVGFLKNDYIVIGDEYIKYNGKTDTSFDAGGLLSDGRGWNESQAVAHAAGTKVYSSTADPLNAALGFNIMSTGDTVGEVDIIDLGGRFLSTTLPRFVTWDYGILQVGAFTYVRTVLQLLGGAFIIYLALNMVGAFGRQ